MPDTTEAEQTIVDAMKRLTFTASDARAYLALLQSSPATGYDVAARSGVPRSAIYNVLRRLEGLGLINEVQKKPAKFVPLAPDGLCDLLEARFSRQVDSLRTALKDLSVPHEDPAVWSLHGYRAMLDGARTLISAAETIVHASLWRREALALHDDFLAARERGVEVVLFSFTELPDELGQVFCYGIDEQQLEEHWPHKVILIGDRKRLLIGGAEPTETCRSVVTTEPTLVEMSTSNVVLDLTLFGQRMNVEVGPVVAGLTEYLAPLEDLLRSRSDYLESPKS